MWNWEYCESVETTATPEQIWKVWHNVEEWPKWDKAIQWAKIDGPFEVGTVGALKPEGFPVTKFTITDVEPLKGYSDVSKLPFTTIKFDHSMEQISENRVRITHHVETKGLLAFLLRFTLLRQLKKGLKNAITKLTRLAENE